MPSSPSAPMHWLHSLLQDTRYGLRTLRRSPPFTDVAIITLTLGIATTPAAIGVVATMEMRGLPYRGAGRLMAVYERSDQSGYRTPSFHTYADWETQGITVVDATHGFAFIRVDAVMLATPSGYDRKTAAY